MDYKKTNAPTNTVTRDMVALSSDTGNIYETVCIIAKRANQIAVDGEGAITSAIDYVVSDELPKLYFVEGHARIYRR